MKGTVEVWDLPLHGGPRRLLAGGNVVTDGGRLRVLEGLPGLSTAPVLHVAIGDGGVVLSAPLEASPPVPGDREDTALRHEVTRKPAASIVMAASPAAEVLYTVTFLTVSLPLAAFLTPSSPVLNEVGLFVDSEDLLATRFTFASIPFSATDRTGLEFRWTLVMI